MTAVQDLDRLTASRRQHKRSPAGMGAKTHGRLAEICRASHVHSLARDRRDLMLAGALDLCVKLPTWPNPNPISCARPAAQPRPNGLENARPAAAGTPSPKRESHRPSAVAPPAGSKAANSRWRI